jgi:hypothetical protein
MKKVTHWSSFQHLLVGNNQFDLLPELEVWEYYEYHVVGLFIQSLRGLEH